MYIAIYCVVIVVFTVAVILFFYFKNKKDKMRLDAFNRGESIDLKGNKSVQPEKKYDFDKETEELEPTPVFNIENLEDYELDMSEDDNDLFEVNSEKNKNKDENEIFDIKNEFKDLFNTHFNKKMSSNEKLSDVKKSEDDFPKFSNPFFINTENENSNFKNRIQNSSGIKPKKGYAEPSILPVNEQQFPNSKKYPKFSIKELDSLASFDLDLLKGKSEMEIYEIIKNLPKQAREMILKELFNKDNKD